MSVDDSDLVDVDAPIPYVLTAAGHREVAEWRLVEQMESCDHRWRAHHGVLECDHCGLDREIPRPTLGSIRTYLKGRER